MVAFVLQFFGKVGVLMATPHNNASLEDVSKVVLVTVDRVRIK